MNVTSVECIPNKRKWNIYVETALGDKLIGTAKASGKFIRGKLLNGRANERTKLCTEIESAAKLVYALHVKYEARERLNKITDATTAEQKRELEDLKKQMLKILEGEVSTNRSVYEDVIQRAYTFLNSFLVKGESDAESLTKKST